MLAAGKSVAQVVQNAWKEQFVYHNAGLDGAGVVAGDEFLACMAAERFAIIRARVWRVGCVFVG